MIVGETLAVTHTESAADALTLVSPSLTVTFADGTVASPTVTLSGNGTTAVRMSANVTVAVGGPVTLRWTFQTGGSTRIRDETYFSTYGDVHGRVRSQMLLNTDADSLPDAVIDQQLAQLVPAIVSEYSDDGMAYESLSEADRFHFDDALSFFAAARLYAASTGHEGSVTERREGDVAVKYAQGEGEKSSRSEWMGLGWEALRRVSAIKSRAEDVRNSFTLFALAGHRRSVEARYGVVPITSPLRALLDDEVYRTWP
jgi:hypothetical protein